MTGMTEQDWRNARMRRVVFLRDAAGILQVLTAEIEHKLGLTVHKWAGGLKVSGAGECTAQITLLGGTKRLRLVGCNTLSPRIHDITDLDGDWVEPVLDELRGMCAKS